MPTPPARGMVSGPDHRVPCPHCQQPNDLRAVLKLGVLEESGDGLIECDHCHQLMVFVKSTPINVITVRQGQRRAPGGGGGQARQATTISPAQAQRLLRGR